MFSILKWTPHHWVLFDDSHHSALPATTDIVECLGTSITNCIVLVTEPGTKGSTSKPWKHGFPWKGCWEFIGDIWDIPTFFQPEVDEGTHFPLPGVCFLGPRLLLQVQNLQAMALAICQDKAGVLSQWWIMTSFTKLCQAVVKHPNITQDWRTLIIPKTVVWGSLGSQSDLISSAKNVQSSQGWSKWKNSSRIRMPKQKICQC